MIIERAMRLAREVAEDDILLLGGSHGNEVAAKFGVTRTFSINKSPHVCKYMRWEQRTVEVRLDELSCVRLWVCQPEALRRYLALLFACSCTPDLESRYAQKMNPA